MISRREMLVGGLLLGAAGGAYAMTPRNKVSLLGNRKLNDMIPRSFAGWSELPADSLVVAESENSLAARLYSETVGRVYQNADNEPIMMLIAYGDTQSDQLQLHRPEVCYPAFGFEIEGVAPAPLQLAPGVTLPARRLVAKSHIRQEQILYWTRIGEFLPTTGSEQRWARLKGEIRGILADGVLVRLSNFRTDPAAGFALNQQFASAFVDHISAEARRALMGTAISRQLSA